MTDNFSNYTLQRHAESIADEALLECDGNIDDAAEFIQQTCDGHEWVIYHHKAIQICASCNTDIGEAFLEDVGMPETPTLNSIASLIVYAELEGRAMAHLMKGEA